MDIGIITPEPSSEAAASEPFSICAQKSVGRSGLLKHQRSDTDTWQPTKIPKVSDNNTNNSFCVEQSVGLLRSGSGISGNNGQTMICFSSQPQNQISYFGDADADGAKTSSLPFFLCSSATGYQAEKSVAGIHGPFSRFRGPFTPSQWMELEHQAMIYKHFISNIPVPSHLLIPLRKAFNPYTLSSFSSGSYASNSLGWGSFRVGYGGSSDPEPGRCRRTDGKKWRCSRDAVPDQKYCERHLNRGRHRSRKPVEGQPGHAIPISGSAASKVAKSAISSASAMSISRASNSLGALQNSFKSLQPNAPSSSCDQLAIRPQDIQGYPVPRDAFNLKEAEEAQLFSQKQQARFGGSLSDFGLVSPDSLLNPSERISRRNSDSPFGLNDQDGDDQYPLRHFIDNWPKDQSNQASSWPEELKLDWTQLSMSIPVSESDFSASSNSMQLHKPKLSTLELSSVLDTTKMELDVINEPKQNHTNWLPVSWADSVGGPLGEALNSAPTPSISEGLKNSPALNLVSDAWDNNSQLGRSPTGVLQKSTFVSRSNSSSEKNSPGAGNNKAPKGSGLHGDILTATLESLEKRM